MTKTLANEIITISQDFYLLEDWTDLDKSMINHVSTETFKSCGTEVFSKKKSKRGIVPHLISTSLPHARNLAKIIKTGLAAKQKIRVLECGAGSGLFSRNFLIAAQEIGLLNNLEYIISDISKQSLIDIKENPNLLDGFNENTHYKFVVLDLLNFETAQDLDANAVELGDLDLVIFNYVIDALPMLPIRKLPDDNFEKQQLRLLSIEDKKPNDNIDLKKLNIESRWVSLDKDSLDPLQKKFFNTLLSVFSEYPVGEELRYSCTALEAFETLHSKLSENGMVYIADIPSPRINDANRIMHYSLYGNTKANFIQESLILNYFKSLEYSYLQKKEANLARMLFSKNDAITARKDIKDLFLGSTEIEQFSQIVTLFPRITDLQLAEVLKVLRDKLLEIDNKSATAFTLQGSYHFLTKDYQKAMEFYKKALEIDFSAQWDLEFKINGTEAFL